MFVGVVDIYVGVFVDCFKVVKYVNGGCVIGGFSFGFCKKVVGYMDLLF